MQETEIILTHDKYIKMEIEPLEINDETIEKTKRGLVEIYRMLKKEEEKKNEELLTELSKYDKKRRKEKGK